MYTRTQNVVTKNAQLFPSMKSFTAIALTLLAAPAALAQSSAPPSSSGQPLLPGQSTLFDPAYAQFVGWGVRFDTDTGMWILMRPILQLLAPLPTSMPQTERRLNVENHNSNQSNVSEQELTASVTTNIGVTKAGAEIGLHKKHSSSAQEQTLSIVLDQGFESAMIDLTNPSKCEYTPEARAILDSTSMTPEEKAQVWRGKFGTHVIVGNALHCHLGLRIGMTNSQSYDSISSYVKVAVKAPTYSGDAGLADAVNEAMSMAGLTMSWDYEGSGSLPSTFPAVPAPQQVADPAARSAFVSTVVASLADHAAVVGVEIKPASSLPGAPDVSIPGWAGLPLDHVGQSAYDALNQWDLAQMMHFPRSRWKFLQSCVVPGGADSYAARLEAYQATLEGKLAELWPLTQAYMRPENSGNVAVRDAMLSKRSEVDSASLQLFTLRDQIDRLGIDLNLPQPTANLYENFVPDASGCQLVWREFSCKLDYVAMYTDGSYQDRMNWLRRALNPEGSLFHLAFYEERNCEGGNLRSVTPDSLSILEDTEYTSGPEAGLHKLRIKFNLFSGQQSSMFHAYLTDDLHRSAQGDVNAFNNNWP